MFPHDLDLGYTSLAEVPQRWCVVCSVARAVRLSRLGDVGFDYLVKVVTAEGGEWGGRVCLGQLAPLTRMFHKDNAI